MWPTIFSSWLSLARAGSLYGGLPGDSLVHDSFLSGCWNRRLAGRRTSGLRSGEERTRAGEPFRNHLPPSGTGMAASEAGRRLKSKPGALNHEDDALGRKATLREGRRHPGKNPGVSGRKTTPRLTKTASQEERRRSGKKDGVPGRKTAPHLTKTASREERRPPVLRTRRLRRKDGGPGRKTAVREERRGLGTLKNRPGQQIGRPDGKKPAVARKMAAGNGRIRFLRFLTAGRPYDLRRQDNEGRRL